MDTADKLAMPCGHAKYRIAADSSVENISTESGYGKIHMGGSISIHLIRETIGEKSISGSKYW